MNYTIIVPFYNEEKNISPLNKQLLENLNNLGDEKRSF